MARSVSSVSRGRVVAADAACARSRPVQHKSACASRWSYRCGVRQYICHISCRRAWDSCQSSRKGDPWPMQLNRPHSAAGPTMDSGCARACGR